MLDLFFPLAFFLFALSMAVVVVAFLVLDQATELTWQVQRFLGLWFAVFGVVLAGMLVFLLQTMFSGGADPPVASDGSLGPLGSLWKSLLGLLLPTWVAAFFVLTVIAAYFLLFLWSSEASVGARGITRRLAIGRDAIAKDALDKVVEVIFLYSISSSLKRLRSRSLFVFVARRRGPLFRYALFRPANAVDEDEFRDEVRSLAPLAVVVLPGLPKLPSINFS